MTRCPVCREIACNEDCPARVLREEVGTLKAQARAVNEALEQMLGDIQANGGHFTVAVQDATLPGRYLTAMALGHQVIHPSPYVTLTLEQLIGVWTVLSYYTKGLIKPQPLQVALDFKQDSLGTRTTRDTLKG